MPAPRSDYFRYFPMPRAAADWGVAVTGSGCTRIAPGTPYPPGRHPSDRDFDWEHGRVLEALQVVLITAGRGRIETRSSKPQIVTPGSVFVLFPRIWHRYRPDFSTGWNESWVELQGPTVNRLLRSGVLSPRQPVLNGVLATRLEAALEGVHARALHSPPGFDPELAVQGLAVVAACHSARHAPAWQSRIAVAVGEAERHFAEHLTEAVDVAQLARRLGVAYSHFRKAFKTHTGYSPWQYMINLRLLQARRILAASDATLDEVAARVGFSSSYHLSAVFKQSYGISPDPWRRQFLAGRVVAETAGWRPSPGSSRPRTS